MKVGMIVPQGWTGAFDGWDPRRFAKVGVEGSDPFARSKSPGLEKSAE